MEKQERNTLLIRNNEKKGKLINCSVFVDISTKAVAAGLSLSFHSMFRLCLASAQTD